MSTPATWKGEPVRLLMTGRPVPVWQGLRDSPSVMLFNFDQNNSMYAGYQPNIALNGVNTQWLPPNFGLTMNGQRTLYVIGPNGAGPLQATPGGDVPFQLSNLTFVTTPSNTPAEDASTPATVVSTNALAVQPTVTTAAFSPPANTTLVAVVEVGNVVSTWNVTVTNTGTALTWTKAVSVFDSAGFIAAVIFIARNASAQAGITVSAQQTDASTSTQIQLSLRVVNNANVNQTGAATATNTNGNVAQTNTQVAITPTKIGSLIYVAGAQNSNQAQTPLSGTTGIASNVNATDSLCQMSGKSTNNTTVLSSTTFGWSTAVTNFMACAALEILP